MFGLTIEKLFLIAIIAGVIIGPRRLPLYAAKVADFARGLRSFVDSARAQAEREAGVSLSREQWQTDLRKYDPRRIVREALESSPEGRPTVISTVPRPDTAGTAEVASAPEPVSAASATAETASGTEPAASGTEPASAASASEPAEPPASAPAPRYVVVGGTSGHPRRVLVSSPPPEAEIADEKQEEAPAAEEETAAASPEAATEEEVPASDATPTAPRKYKVVGGSSGHPRRVLVNPPTAETPPEGDHAAEGDRSSAASIPAA
ncbi:MAG: hypothetical protein QM604_10345 [Microbacterium sp.]